jgi:hypothetical protein
MSDLTDAEIEVLATALVDWQDEQTRERRSRV